MSSKVEFDRWNPKDDNSVPYAIYNSQTGELRRLYVSMLDAKGYVYHSLKADRNAQWGDKPGIYFPYPEGIVKTNAYSTTMKEWSDSFNQFDNWNNLNVLVAVNSIFETYLVKVIQLALESDVGVLYGVPHGIDGVKSLKNGKKLDFSVQVISCTKGEWSSRISNFVCCFGSIPPVFKDNCGELDKIRKMRNDVAHSFGRVLDDAHDAHTVAGLSMQPLSGNQLIKRWNLLDRCAKEMDNMLFKNHIGEYLNVCLYHVNRQTIIDEMALAKMEDTNGSRARVYRKLFGHMDKAGIETLGSRFSKGLVDYYEAL